MTAKQARAVGDPRCAPEAAMVIRQTHLSYYSRAMMVVGASVALITILETIR